MVSCAHTVAHCMGGHRGSFYAALGENCDRMAIFALHDLACRRVLCGLASLGNHLAQAYGAMGIFFATYECFLAHCSVRLNGLEYLSFFV